MQSLDQKESGFEWISHIPSRMRSPYFYHSSSTFVELSASHLPLSYFSVSTPQTLNADPIMYDNDESNRFQNAFYTYDSDTIFHHLKYLIQNQNGLNWYVLIQIV